MGKVTNQKVCGALAQHSPLFALKTSVEALEAADAQALPGFAEAASWDAYGVLLFAWFCNCFSN